MFNKFINLKFITSPKECIKYNNKVLYMDFIIGIPAIARILIVNTILIIICNPKKIGSNLTQKINIDNITLKITFFIIPKYFLDTILIPQI